MVFNKVTWIFVPLLFMFGFVNAIPSLQTSRDDSIFLGSDLNKFHKTFRIPTNPRFRLPEAVLPKSYHITMAPILEDEPTLGETWTAPSHVTITVNCLEQTNSITLHSAVNSIDEDSVTVRSSANNQSITIASHTYDVEKEFYIITLATSLLANQEYVIDITYIAPVALDRLDGLYRSHYIDPQTGASKYLAATQFQAYGARRAFPCFDEPSFKATFEMVLGRKSNYNALSSAPVRETVPHQSLPSWFYDHFEPTVPMSTCVLAIVISDYAAAPAPPNVYFDKPVQIILPKYLIDQGAGDYAAIIAAKDLAYFEEYYGEKYAMAKMDSTGIQDFAPGAMENWGLNIYRETYLVYLEGVNTEADRRRTGEIIAHELAHQWFGNLVTCKWWIGAWLNEGHASYVQYLGLNHTNPEFESLKALQTDAKQHAMRYDVMENSHPTLLPDKGNPYDTMSYSAPLVYQKGASVIRMMEGFLTIETLQQAYREYLRRFAFMSTEQDDLFNVLQEFAGQSQLPATMKEIMDTFTLQRGFPLVRVIREGGNRILMLQELFKNHDSKWEDTGNVWHIPVAVSTESNPSFSSVPELWIHDSDVVSRDHNTSQWILLNAGGTGYYRVLYDSVLTQHLQRQLELNHLAIPDGSRSQILDDYFTFAYQKYNSMDAALDFTKYLGKETEHYVWVPALLHLRKFYTLARGTPYFDQFSAYLSPKLGEVLETIGLEQPQTDRGLVVLFRTQLLDWACGMSLPGCLNYATKLYDQWKASPDMNPIPQDLRPVLYCTAVRVGEIKNFEFAASRYLVETIPRQKTLNAASLGCVSDNAQLLRLLDIVIESPSLIAIDDAPTVFNSVASNSDGITPMFMFLLLRLDRILAYFGSQQIVASIVSTLSSQLFTEGDYEGMREFIEINRGKLSDIAGSLNNSLAVIQSNIDWMAMYGMPIANWMQTNGIHSLKEM